MSKFGMLANTHHIQSTSKTTLESNSLLSSGQIREFHDRGILRLESFHTVDLCAQLSDAFWNAIGSYGVARDDMSTWTFAGNPVFEFRPLKNALKQLRLNALYTPSLRRVAQVLVGEDDLTKTSAQWLVTFPEVRSRDPNESWEVPRTVWHTDCPRLPGNQAPGVVVLNFLSNVGPKGGGTPVVAGSHRLFCSSDKRLSSRQFKRKLKRHEFFQTLYSKSSDRPKDLRGTRAIVEGIEVEVVELTGTMGEVVFLDGRILHSIAKNVSTTPRLMARTFFGSHALFDSYGINIEE